MNCEAINFTTFESMAQQAGRDTFIRSPESFCICFPRYSWLIEIYGYVFYQVLTIWQWMLHYFLELGDCIRKWHNQLKVGTTFYQLTQFWEKVQSDWEWKCCCRFRILMTSHWSKFFIMQYLWLSISLILWGKT